MALHDRNDHSSSVKHQQPQHPPPGQQTTALEPSTAPSSVHNRSTSYHHLPVELLAWILNLRFPDTDRRSKKDMAEVYLLRLVSKSWKELVEGTPALWTYVSARFPTVVVRDCLRWSKNHLLWVMIWDTWSNPLENLLEFFHFVQPHSHRWKTLEYSIKDGSWIDSMHCRNFLESPAPMLQEIEVNLSGFYEGPGLNLAGGVAKELKHMTLNDAILQDCSNFLHGLETFSLDTHHSVPTRELLNIFVKNPALKRFELLCFSEEDQSNPTTSATQELDAVATSLEQVIISQCPEIITQVLSQVSMPNCKYLELGADLAELDDDVQLLDQALAQFVPRIREALSLCGRTTLSVKSEYGYDWSNSSEDEGFQFSFGWTNMGFWSLRKWIRRLIGALESPLELEIIIPTPYRRIAERLGELDEFEVTALTIQHPANSKAQWGGALHPDFLGNALVDSTGGHSWNFPNLRELDLSSAQYELSAILGMLDRRYLPDSDVRAMEERGISIQVPPKIDLCVQDTTEAEDAAIMTALENHRGVRSLSQGE